MVHFPSENTHREAEPAVVGIDNYFVRRNAQGAVVCTTCGDLGSPASHVATYDKTDGSGRGAWALCSGHAPFGLIAWGALTPIADFLASEATHTPSQAQDGYGAPTGAECAKDPLDILIDDAFEKMGQQPADERLTPETDANCPDNGGSAQGNPND